MHTLRRFPFLSLWLILLPAIASAQSGGLRYTITVTEFDNQSSWHGQRHLGNAWSTVMTDLLNQSGRFIVIGDESMRRAALEEQDLGASGLAAQGKKTPKSGYLTPAQLLLRGTITYVQFDSGEQKGGLNLGKVRLGGKRQQAEIGATIYMVDSTTGQVVASTNVKGQSKSRRGMIHIRDGNKSLELSGKKNDNLVKAISDAVGQSMDWLVEQLPFVPWSGTVVTVAEGEVVVDRGAREGVQPGQIFRVGTTEILRSPDSGEVLDESLKQIAEIEVTRVRPKVSYCKVLSGDPRAIRKGLSVQLP